MEFARVLVERVGNAEYFRTANDMVHVSDLSCGIIIPDPVLDHIQYNEHTH